MNCASLQVVKRVQDFTLWLDEPSNMLKQSGACFLYNLNLVYSALIEERLQSQQRQDLLKGTLNIISYFNTFFFPALTAYKFHSDVKIYLFKFWQNQGDAAKHLAFQSTESPLLNDHRFSRA